MVCSGSTSGTQSWTTQCKHFDFLYIFREIWENAHEEFSRTQQHNWASGQWMASDRLIRILKSGMRECQDVDEKVKIVYGFEQVLPPASAYL